MASLPNAPAVVFLDILDQYSFNSDLTCQFKISSNYESRGNDSVAIFKLGWTHVIEYVCIKSVQEVVKDKICSVTISRHLLPKNTSDLYQICYISGTDLCGASTPFQFYAEDTMSVSTGFTFLSSSDSMTKSQLITEKDQEISRLKDENAILKESLKTVLSHKSQSSSKYYDEDIKVLKDLVEGVQSMLSVHDRDIKMLKNKIKEGGEEYVKLYIEKFRVQRKYEKLKTKYSTTSVDQDNQPIENFTLDLGDLKSIPPFPSILKQ